MKNIRFQHSEEKKKLELSKLELLKIEDRIKLLEEKFFDLDKEIDSIDDRINNIEMGYND